jgi:hypothetical protein
MSPYRERFLRASDLMAFMQNHGFTDEVRQIQEQARQQAIAYYELADYMELFE